MYSFETSMCLCVCVCKGARVRVQGLEGARLTYAIQFPEGSVVCIIVVVFFSPRKDRANMFRRFNCEPRFIPQECKIIFLALPQ